MRHPPLESPRTGNAGAEDRGEQTGLGDDGDLLRAAGGLHNLQTLLVVVERAGDRGCFGIAEEEGDIGRDEPGVAVTDVDADRETDFAEVKHLERAHAGSASRREMPKAMSPESTAAASAPRARIRSSRPQGARRQAT